MDKIIYNLVFNRKNSSIKRGQALVQVEAYLNRKKNIFLPKSIYVQINGITKGEQ